MAKSFRKPTGMPGPLKAVVYNPPTKPLTDRAITRYIKAGLYGEERRERFLAAEKLKRKKGPKDSCLPSLSVLTQRYIDLVNNASGGTNQS